MKDLRTEHKQQLASLKAALHGNTLRLKVRKKTISNLFRYEGRNLSEYKEVDLRAFNKPLYIDTKNQTLEVQGLTTYESIVDFCLPHGFLPTITPELKHITIGGAMVGIGIESNCYHYGFVHDGLIEADVLLPDGKIVTVDSRGKYKDLFYALPNSYGSLGYILRAKIRLRSVKPYVRLHTKKIANTKDLITALKDASQEKHIEHIESLVYNKNRMFMTVGEEIDKPDKLTSIYGKNLFYKEISREGVIDLTTKDYIFRYDPEWFWNIPQDGIYQLYRKISPKRFRNSGFFTRYNKLVAKLKGKVPNQVEDENLEMLIQDWEVPWRHAKSLLDFALDNVDLEWRPWLITLIKTSAKATNYPMEKNELYLNLGCYSFAVKQKGAEKYHNTKIMDEYCFTHNGIKMLYSSTFLPEAEFNAIYNGAAYAKVKAKYDPKQLQPSLYEKTVKAA